MTGEGVRYEVWTHDFGSRYRIDNRMDDTEDLEAACAFAAKTPKRSVVVEVTRKIVKRYN